MLTLGMVAIAFLSPIELWLWLHPMEWKLMVHWLTLLPCQYCAINILVIKSKSSCISNVTGVKGAVWEPLGYGFLRMLLELKSTASHSHNYCHPIFSRRWLIEKLLLMLQPARLLQNIKDPLINPLQCLEHFICRRLALCNMERIATNPGALLFTWQKSPETTCVCSCPDLLSVFIKSTVFKMAHNVACR